MKQDSNIKLIGICIIVVLFAVQALVLYLGVKRNASRPQCPPCTERAAFRKMCGAKPWILPSLPPWPTRSPGEKENENV